jgi:enterochelin esterase family protein
MNKLLDLARTSGTPIVDRQTVTFLWEGEQAPALIADFNDWGQAPNQLVRLGEKTWIHKERLSIDAYIEYAYLDLESEERIVDPHNPRTVSNGMGDINHFFHMPGAIPNPLTRRARGTPKGKTTRHLISTDGLAIGKHRRVHLYQPPSAAACPLIIVLDGNDYLRRGKLIQILDNLIAQKRVSPVALALVSHAGEARAVEYLSNDATLGFLNDCVLPLAYQELNLVNLEANPGAFGIMGASMGGLMALYAGLRMPEIFGKVLTQSGLYNYDDHDFAVMDLVRYTPIKPIKIWMDVGKYEYLRPTNQKMHDLLAEKGYQVCYREYPGGHNYTSWRDDLWRGLEYLFPAL